MAERLSPAKVILLAVNLAINANDTTDLRALVFQYRKILRNDIVLRILLTYLPETLDSSTYVPFLKELVSGQENAETSSFVDIASVADIDEEDAVKRVRKLHLETLSWQEASEDVPDDPFVLFLVHRAYKIDQETGISTQLPELIGPFLDTSPFLRTWMITTLLPLLRMNYEYHPQNSTRETVAAFEQLDDHMGVEFLLSRSGRNAEAQGAQKGNDVGRDLRGLIGPWLYGDNRQKRRKLQRPSSMEGQTVQPLDGLSDAKNVVDVAWENVFQWIISQATTSWVTCANAIEQWEGPGDIDLGGYSDGSGQLSEDKQRRLEYRYARTSLASAYLIAEASIDALEGVRRILSRTAGLMDFDHLPPLATGASLLPPIHTDETSLQLPEHAKYLCNHMVEEINVLTTPNKAAVDFLYGLVLSAFLTTRAGIPCNIRKAGQLALLQEEKDQYELFRNFLTRAAEGQRGDDKYWMRIRNEVLWLHSWGSEELSDGEGIYGRGVFGKIKKDFLEVEILKALLGNTRYTLAQSIYESSGEQILSRQQLQDAVVSSALKAYDNSSNANRTRGGVKKCDEIVTSLPKTMEGTEAKRRIQSLIKVTHSVGKYRLVLKQGEPFVPVNMRVHQDPISLISKILEQNPQTYTQMQEFIDMAEGMVDAGLTIREVAAKTSPERVQEVDHNGIVKRVQAMCIDAALNEDDFETAYSFTMTRLSTPPLSDRSRPQKDGEYVDDYSWRAAIQAGKYRLNTRTTRPTHVGNASGNLEIRHLEQRLECISLALRIAPPSTLQEILNVSRRCEEELEVKLKEDAEAEAEWDNQADQTVMPGGFGPEEKPTSLSRHGGARGVKEDGPVSIFDLTKASAAQAQKTLSAISGLKLGSERSHQLSASSVTKPEEPVRTSGEYERVRKRDQLREAAVGTLASGVGWLIGAGGPPTQASTTSDR